MSLHIREGGAVVCAIVVLTLISMLSIQTLQALHAVSRGTREHARIQQTRELIELGILVSRARFARGESLSGLYEVEISGAQGDALTQLGTIEIQSTRREPSNSSDGNAPLKDTVELTARYPAGATNEITIRWTGEIP